MQGIVIITQNRKRLLKRATVLALITIFYNILEGVVSLYFGLEDETIALAGFGVDSFVEVLSGIGIFHMIERIKRNGNVNPDRFERTALTVTSIAFYILTAGLVITSGINLYLRKRPETTLWGIIISLISIFTMWLLIRMKLNVGKRLNSDAIIADAHCTRACMYLSIILLISSAGYEITGIGDLDSLGGLGIALWSFKEGREAFQKAKGLRCSCQSCSV